MKNFAILFLVVLSQAIWNLPSSASEGFFPRTGEEEVAIQDPELDRAIPEPELDRVIPEPELDRTISEPELDRAGVADDSIRVLPPGDDNARIDAQEAPAWVYTWIQSIKGW